ncbi:MAG: 1-pyrroline-5-carboxylate dehydrogenase [Gammaproteobacteria bacterium]|nr:1-pyrroline-5-carboxylate dehydrogenase [Gammaproteobacteria bacterium]
MRQTRSQTIMFRNPFKNTLYIKVHPNRFDLKHIESGKSLSAVSPTPFTTSRLLVGQFLAAHETLKAAIKSLYAGQLFAPSPVAVIHPLEKCEDGLSEVEERALHELAAGAGARKVVVWVGHALSDSEVLAKLST